MWAVAALTRVDRLIANSYLIMRLSRSCYGNLRRRTARSRKELLMGTTEAECRPQLRFANHQQEKPSRALEPTTMVGSVMEYRIGEGG